MISLILEKGYESLTIQDIAERADVGRSTFYMHFSSKDDLLMSGFDELEEAVTRQQGARRASRDARSRLAFGFSLPLLEHIHEHRRIYHAVVGRPSGDAVERRLRRMVATLVQQDMGASSRLGKKAVLSFDAVVAFVVGAFLALVFWWLESAAQLPAEEVDGIFRRLALPGVDAVLGPQSAR